ncbi:ATP-binding cassette domain-containing protein [Paenibacillus crassostreae]|uniref:ABC transporter n=1 Tax=Paenibacillus crassostreae TaxID=1763538 RepID=A0A162RKD1_9BACL|nr:ABC transporter ATP-binding protein [Paenibacillus crassostreae]AOZ91780.1 ABC transporter [Paenibacillus crassostreae]OAB72647.1 ABC transporter [Paenibacillus crassostreae]
MNSDSLVTLNNITKQYDKRTVLSSISMTINQGESIILRGSNGSGKSTLLKIFAGLINPTSGERELRNSKLIIGYTPDRMSKLKMTSTEYLTHMGKIAGISNKQLDLRIKELHELFNLEPIKSPNMLHYSKGMLQKVNLMQASLKVPDLLVLDEPFSGLDTESIEHLLTSLKNLRGQGTAILAAVHDPLLAKQLISRTFWIRQGRLLEGTEQSLKFTAFYELECQFNQRVHFELTTSFPEVIWTLEDKGYRYTIFEEDYRDFVLMLLNNGGVIIYLRRRDALS